MTKLKNILIFGGTHGNEWTGIYAIKKLSQSPSPAGHSVEYILANPKAFELKKRFVDEDLNRAFEFLSEDRPHSYEHKKARELKKKIESSPCLVVDIHTTTANMGTTVILTRSDPYNFRLAQKLALKFPELKIIFSPDPHKKYLVSQSDYGLMIEIGPVANNILHGQALEVCEELIHEIFRLMPIMDDSSVEVEVYEEIEDVYYPLEEGELWAYIHSHFQGKDFTPLLGTYIPFKSFRGEDILKSTEETLYPIFINEAAYYPVHLAYTLCRKKIIKI